MVVRQHFIPRSVLKFFKESDDINNEKRKRIYHILHPDKAVYPSTLMKTMMRDDFYEVSDFQVNAIENQLSVFESKYSKNIMALKNSIDLYNDKLKKFNDIKSECLLLLPDMILMHLRSGAMVFELGHGVEKKKQKVRIYRMLERILNINYITAFSEALINFHEFGIICSREGNFIISDQFMSTAALSFKAQFFNSTNRHVGMKDVIALFPISKHYYICYFNGAKPNYIKSNKFNLLTEKEVKEVNQVIINNSYMETAGSSIESIRSVLPFYRHTYPHTIMAGGEGYSFGNDLRKEVFFYEKDKELWEFIRDPMNWRRYYNTKKMICVLAEVAKHMVFAVGTNIECLEDLWIE